MKSQKTKEIATVVGMPILTGSVSYRLATGEGLFLDGKETITPKLKYPSEVCRNKWRYPVYTFKFWVRRALIRTPA
ncbi:MAG: hypothetical protein AAF634_06520, partial [Bacteroidota bacterium]